MHLLWFIYKDENVFSSLIVIYSIDLGWNCCKYTEESIEENSKKVLKGDKTCPHIQASQIITYRYRITYRGLAVKNNEHNCVSVVETEARWVCCYLFFHSLWMYLYN